MKTVMNMFALCMLLLCTGGEAAAQIALKPADTAVPAPAQAQEITAAELQEKDRTHHRTYRRSRGRPRTRTE